jgi:hypothetical protein
LRVATLGRVDELAQDGTLDRLLGSGVRFANNAVVLTAYEKGEVTASLGRSFAEPDDRSLAQGTSSRPAAFHDATPPRYQ